MKRIHVWFLASLFLCFLSPIFSLHIHTCFEEWFGKYIIPLEHTSYKLLKDNPIPSDITYFAVPWKHIIDNVGLHKVVPELEKKMFIGGFTVCQHIHPKQIIPILKKIGIDVLFTPHVSSQKIYDGVTLVPFPHYAMCTVATVPTKDLLYSFIGFESHRLRRKIFGLKKKNDILIKKRRWWAFTSGRWRDRREFTKVLARSRFALCPRGSGPSTLRLWEALSMGSIPVLIADDIVLPSGYDWDTCIFRVAEKDAHDVDRIIRAISIKQEEQMRKHCFAAYKLFSGDNLVRVIREYYVGGNR